MKRTDLSRGDIEKIISNYDLGKLKEYSYFEKGIEHTNVLIVTSNGKYVLRLYEKGRTIDFVNFEIELLKKLNKMNFPTPRVIKSISGKELLLLGEKPFAMFTYLKGKHLIRPNLNHIKQVGEYLARLHLITQNFKPKGADLRWNANVENMGKLGQKLINEGKESHIKNIELIEKTIEKEFVDFYFPDSLPKGILHADLFEDNVKFHNGKLEGFLDFDDAFYGNLIEDLNTAILGWCFPENKFSMVGAKEMVRSYQQVRKLTELEEKYLYLSLRFMALKFGIYVMNRMEKEKDAKNSFFQQFFSLSKVSKEEFEKVVLKCPKKTDS